MKEDKNLRWKQWNNLIAEQPQIVSIMCSIISATHQMHYTVRCVHGDMRPANALIDRNGRAIISLISTLPRHFPLMNIQKPSKSPLHLVHHNHHFYLRHGSEIDVFAVGITLGFFIKSGCVYECNGTKDAKQQKMETYKKCRDFHGSATDHYENKNHSTSSMETWHYDEAFICFKSWLCQMSAETVEKRIIIHIRSQNMSLPVAKKAVKSQKFLGRFASPRRVILISFLRLLCFR